LGHSQCPEEAAAVTTTAGVELNTARGKTSSTGELLFTIKVPTILRHVYID
jgi:hypothetical protein